MGYIINTLNQDKVERLNKDNKNSAYKNLIFSNMKDAYNYNLYIRNSKLEEMGITIYDSTAKLYKEYIDYLEQVAQKKEDCEKLLSTRAKQYENGYFNTLEWKERDRIDKEYVRLKKEYSAIILEGLEYFHIDIVKRRRNEVYGNSMPIILNALYNDVYASLIDTPELRQYVVDWRQRVLVVKNKIEEKSEEYKRLDDRTKTGEIIIDNLKNQTIRMHEEKKKTLEIMAGLYVQNIINIPGQDIYEFKQVKDIKLKDIVINDKEEYNVFHYFKKTKTVYTVNYIAKVNGRLAIVSDNKNMLLRNEDWVIINRKAKGEVVNFNGINTLMPYLNINEQKAYVPKSKDFDGSDRMKEVFGIEDKNVEIQ